MTTRRRHPFDSRTLYRLVADELAGDNLVAAGYGYEADSAMDALIAYVNATMPLGIVRTGPTTAITAGGSTLSLVADR